MTWAFQPPVFNSTCNIWHDVQTFFYGSPVIPVSGPPDVVADCQLYVNPKMSGGLGGIPFYDFNDPRPEYVSYWISWTAQIMLRLPAGTDIRAKWPFRSYETELHDVVEVPAGTGRYYVVFSVDDVHKGFTNEYRFANIGQLFYEGPWPMA